MKKLILVILCIIFTQVSRGQSIQQKYYDLAKIADSLYSAKQYKSSANKFSEAFIFNGGTGLSNDLYTASCAFALINNPDSAFWCLENSLIFMDNSNYINILTNSDLNSLHSDKRWEYFHLLIDSVDAKLNRPLINQLDSIHKDDQMYRHKIDDITKKYGRDSKELVSLWKTINEKDSINIMKVKSILDTYGWLGSDVIGKQGNTTLFMVIQHSNLETQEKYLPMIREAAKDGKVLGRHLAMIEDRVALGQGKKQIYGSQIGWDDGTKQNYVLPLEDPDNVDKRRAEVGLPPLSLYVKNWQIEWDVEKYKMDLPLIEEKVRKNK